MEKETVVTNGGRGVDEAAAAAVDFRSEPPEVFIVDEDPETVRA